MYTNETAEGGADALSIRDVALFTGVARQIIRQKLAIGAFPGAFKDGRGIWRVPLTDLLVAGMEVDLGRVDPSVVAHAALEALARLRRELAVERERAEPADVVDVDRRRAPEPPPPAKSQPRRVIRPRPPSAWPRGDQ